MRLVSDRHGRWLSAAVLLLSLCARIAVAGWRSEQLTIDRDAYLGIAENLIAGKGFCLPGTAVATAFRPPLYPLLLAAMMAVMPPAAAVAAINLLAGIATVWFVGRIGGALKLGNVRYFAAGLVAIDPLLLHATAQPMTEVLFTLLVTAWLWAMTKDQADQTATGAILAGLFFGLAALCRPTIWPLAGLLAVAGVFKRFEVSAPGRALRPAVLAVITTALVVFPWVIRNQAVFGKPILMTTHGGYTLLLGNNLVYDEEVVRKPWGTTWSGDSLARWQADVEQRLQLTLGSSADELSRDAWMSAEARKFVSAKPDRFRAAILHRIRCLWNVSPQGEAAALPSGLRRGMAMFYVAEYAAAILGLALILVRRQWSAWAPCLLLIITVQGVHLVYWTDARMRTPLEPVLALLAANGLSRLRKPEPAPSD